MSQVQFSECLICRGYVEFLSLAGAAGINNLATAYIAWWVLDLFPLSINNYYVTATSIAVSFGAPITAHVLLFSVAASVVSGVLFEH